MGHVQAFIEFTSCFTPYTFQILEITKLIQIAK